MLLFKNCNKIKEGDILSYQLQNHLNNAELDVVDCHILVILFLEMSILESIINQLSMYYVLRF